jgi:hypothetical protein
VLNDRAASPARRATSAVYADGEGDLAADRGKLLPGDMRDGVPRRRTLISRCEKPVLFHHYRRAQLENRQDPPHGDIS